LERLNSMIPLSRAPRSRNDCGSATITGHWMAEPSHDRGSLLWPGLGVRAPTPGE
jgi:hypothetical protein